MKIDDPIVVPDPLIHTAKLWSWLNDPRFGRCGDPRTLADVPAQGILSFLDRAGGVVGEIDEKVITSPAIERVLGLLAGAHARPNANCPLSTASSRRA